MDPPLHFKRVDVRILSESRAASFLVPGILPLLSEPLEPELAWVCIGAYLDEKMVGVALAKVDYSTHLAHIFSLFVTPMHRRQGIGLALFRFFHYVLLVDEHCQGMGIEYDATSPFAKPMNCLLKELGWPLAKIYLMNCYYSDIIRFHPAWLYQPIPLSDCEIFSWEKLQPRERELILHQAEQGLFLPYLSPFQYATFEPINSVGLRYQGRVIGWNITYRLNSHTIVYAALYIEREFYRTGYAIALLSHSILLQKASGVPSALFKINLKHIESSWLHFVKRRLLPYADQFTKIKQSFYYLLTK